MNGIGALIQDLRAEAHRAPADIAELMRSAATQLAAFVADAGLLEAEVQSAPFPPPPLPSRSAEQAR